MRTCRAYEPPRLAAAVSFAVLIAGGGHARDVFAATKAADYGEPHEHANRSASRQAAKCARWLSHGATTSDTVHRGPARPDDQHGREPSGDRHGHPDLRGGSQRTSDAPIDGQDKSTRTATRTPSIIVGIVAAAVVALSVFYLLRPEPLLVQGEVDATRLDIAARVDGRVKEIPVERGQNVPAGAVLVRIDNPETLAKHDQMRAAMAVAEAQLANVLVGTRVETIAARKAEMSAPKRRWCWRRRHLTALTH